MLLASLILHGLILMVPVSSEEEVVEEEIEEEEPEDLIGLSALQPASPDPEPEPEAAAPTPAPSPVAAAPAPTRQTPVRNQDLAPPTTQTTPSPTPTDSPSPETISATTPTPETSPTAPTGPTTEEINQARTALSDGVGGLPYIAPPVLIDPDRFVPMSAYAAGETLDPQDPNTWQSGIIGIDLHNEGQPDQIRPNVVIERLRDSLETLGATMTELPGGYPAGHPDRTRLFEVVKDGSPIMYINVIPGDGGYERGNSTIVVQWSRNPNLPPGAE